MNQKTRYKIAGVIFAALLIYSKRKILLRYS